MINFPLKLDYDRLADEYFVVDENDEEIIKSIPPKEKNNMEEIIEMANGYYNTFGK